LATDERQPLPLGLAREEQAADGSLRLRNEMLVKALSEGHSVPEVAAALGLTEQAVYRIHAEQASELDGSAAPGSERAALVSALETTSDAVGFEQMVATLVRDIEPAAIAIGGSGDRGRDLTTPDSKTVFTVSTARQWKPKIKADLKKLADQGVDAEKVYAISNRRTSRKTVEALEAEASEMGFDLTVLDQKWLIQKLNEQPHVRLQNVYLGIPLRRTTTFLPADRYRALLDGRPHLSGFEVLFVGREAEMLRAKRMLDSEGVVLLEGAGGYGKTRLALELARESDAEWRFIDAPMQLTRESIADLPPSPNLVVAIDNSHLRDDLGKLLGTLEQLPKGPPKVVLLSRPNFREKLNDAAAARWIGAIENDRVIRIGQLPWAALAQMLKSAPFAIKSGAQRGAILHLAEGNPQIAVIAARIASERRSVFGLSGDELLQRYVAYLIDEKTPGENQRGRQRELLALVAALDGIDIEEAEVVEKVAAMLRLTPSEVEQRLEELAESGIVIGEPGSSRARGPARFRIKPDLLAEHVLFALTLTNRWALALDYTEIFKQFGDHYLLRLVRALGMLSPHLFDEEATGRIVGLERAVKDIVEIGSREEAAALIAALAGSRPVRAQQLADQLLKRIASSGESPSKPVLNRLREGALRMADFKRSWRLLLSLAAASTHEREALRSIGDAMADTYKRLPEDDEASGAILASVQATLARETRRFWGKRQPGAANAVALAVKPMLMVTFAVTRQSADDPMAYELGARILPDSDYTARAVKAGADLAAEVFGELSPRDQLGLMETLGWATNVAAGFRVAMGQPAPMPGRLLLDRALERVDNALAESLETLELPVRAAAYDYLLKRKSYRRKLANEALEDGSISEHEHQIGGVAVPVTNSELEEYIFVIANREIGPLDHERPDVRQRYERKLAQAGEFAQGLAAESDWHGRVDRWSAWWQSRLEIEGPKANLGQAPGMIIDALANGDPERGADLIDHLIESESILRSSTTAAMQRLIEKNLFDRWAAWLSADPMTRAALARALGSFPQEVAQAPMKVLAFDDDPGVREAATSALIFSGKLEKWRIDLALGALALHPDIEGIDHLLHLIDDQAGESTGQRFDPTQLHLLESAILATASSGRIESYQLADALRRAETELDGLVMRWIWKRIEALETMERAGQTHLWDVDFLDEELRPLVGEVAGPEDLSRAIELFTQLNERSSTRADVATVIDWIDPGSEKVTKLMVELLGDADRAWLARSHLMELTLDDEARERRALAFATRLDEPLIPLLDLIAGTLPRSWSGSYVPHLERGLSLAEDWAKSDDPELAAAGHEAAKSYRRRIAAEAADEEVEDLRIAYG
jgi:hypothetical protein